MVDYLSGRAPSGNFLNDIRPGFFGKAFSEMLCSGLVVLSIAAQLLLFFSFLYKLSAKFVCFDASAVLNNLRLNRGGRKH